MPAVSVIVPVYNTEKYVQKCLDSLLAQTLSDIEIICVNDCSTDGSLKILQDYAKKDSRIRIIDFKENRGAAAARNTGIDAAAGEYIGFVDSDDFIDPDFYEKLYIKAKETNADAAKGKLWLYDLKNNSKYLEDWIDINDDVKKHHAYFYFTFTTAIYKREFINQHNIRFLEGLIHFEDPYFTIKAGLFYKTLVLDDSACYYYTNNPESSSRNITEKHAESISNGSKIVLDLINNATIDKEHYEIVFCFVLNQVLSWCNRQDVSDTTNILATKGLVYLLDNCLYKEDCFEYYFLNKKQKFKKRIINELRKKIKQDA